MVAAVAVGQSQRLCPGVGIFIARVTEPEQNSEEQTRTHTHARASCNTNNHGSINLALFRALFLLMELRQRDKTRAEALGPKASDAAPAPEKSR